ncbi:alpha/beta hydrolase family protein [Paenibacillus sp. KN14-4R]|uniref:alpha/beta hydrolase family protein n=1 Tax=Paenibacillus sp. KN14-4R TaxID=3445773 RepID=UPI003FA05F45
MKKKFNMQHKVVVASLSATLLLTPLASAAGVESGTKSTQPISVSVDNRLVPVRTVSETIGASVKWDEVAQCVTVSKGQTQLIFQVGESVVSQNGKAVDLGVKVEFKNDRVQVPLSFLQTALESKIGWDSQAGKVVIASGDVVSTASSFVHALIHSDVAGASALMNDKLKASIPQAQLASVGQIYQSMFGEIGEQISVSTNKNAVHENVMVTYKAQNMPFQMTIRLDQKGLVDDLFLAPSPDMGLYQKPSYDDSKLYTEKEVVVGEGDFALPGTLTMPVDKKNVPVVILVHGSGPNDRDESIGSVKTFRDLAVGLAKQGIAVLRYEKVTREHTLQVSAVGLGKYTVKEETVDDATRAVQLVKKLDGIDPKRIVVAGHSQGGMLIPRIIEADKNQDIASAFILAGPSGSFEDILIEQNEHMLETMKKQGQPTDRLEQQLAMIKQQVSLIKNPAYSTSNLPQGFLLGDPYWFYDFRNYSGAAIAKGQKTPLHIMQGENDWQVLPHHLEGWKKELSNRSNVTYHSYPKVNHTLVEVEELSTGAEYMKPGNVSEVIINDMAKLVKK